MIQNNYKQQLDKCLDLFLQFGLSLAAPEKCDSIRAPYSLFYLHYELLYLLVRQFMRKSLLRSMGNSFLKCLHLLESTSQEGIPASPGNSQKESHYYYYYYAATMLLPHEAS